MGLEEINASETLLSKWIIVYLANLNCAMLGGNETRSGYLQYIQGIQSNLPARTTCRHGLYNSVVHACTSRYILGQNCSNRPLNRPLTTPWHMHVPNRPLNRPRYVQVPLRSVQRYLHVPNRP